MLQLPIGILGSTAYLFTNAQSLKTMQSILVEILNQYQTASANQAANQASQTITPDSIRMAATMIATIPIIMVYPFIQKYFVKGNHARICKELMIEGGKEK